MASTYTTNLRLTKQGDGENPNSWGQILNDGVISLADEAITGYTTISIGSAATVNLTANDGADDESRSAFLEIKGSIGTAATSIFLVIPNKTKSYAVLNKVSANATGNVVMMRVAGNTGVTLSRSSTLFQHVICDGTSVRTVSQAQEVGSFGSLAITGDAAIGGAVSVGGTFLTTGAVKLNSTVTVSGAAIFKSNVSIGGTLTGGGVGSMPTGGITPYSGGTAPTGYLLCYGQAVSRSTYSALFAITSTTYGAGDGSTTFQVPDLRGRVIAGQDDMGGSSANRLTGLSGGVNGDTLGGSGGSETHTLTTAQLAAHTHDAGTYNISTGGDAAQSSTNGAVFRNDVTTSTAVGGDSGSTGSGSAHNNVQPTFILNYIIKT